MKSPISIEILGRLKSLGVRVSMTLDDEASVTVVASGCALHDKHTQTTVNEWGESPDVALKNLWFKITNHAYDLEAPNKRRYRWDGFSWTEVGG